MPDHHITFEKCSPTEDDATLILRWRNDEHTRQMSYHSQQKAWEIFWREYTHTYFLNKEFPPLFAKKDEKKIGFLKCNVVNALQGMPGQTVDVSINMAPEERGRGLGTSTLICLSDFLAPLSVKYIIAEIKKNNIHSIKSFQKAGYCFFDEQIKYIKDIHQEFSILRFIKEI